MARGKSIDVTLDYSVDTLPPRIRKDGKYNILVTEFLASGNAVARLDGSKSTTLVSAKKAAAAVGEGKVEAVVRNGEVYLVRTDMDTEPKK